MAEGEIGLKRTAVFTLQIKHSEHGGSCVWRQLLPVNTNIYINELDRFASSGHAVQQP